MHGVARYREVSVEGMSWVGWLVYYVFSVGGLSHLHSFFVMWYLFHGQL